MKLRLPIAFAIVLVASLLLAHPLCNAIFQCGCSMTALTRHCNIHDRFSPHCPWCVNTAGAAAVFISALIGAALANYITLRKFNGNIPLATLAGLIAFLALAALLSLPLAKLDNYPTWFGLSL